jgi:hypothetical protein
MVYNRCPITFGNDQVSVAQGLQVAGNGWLGNLQVNSQGADVSGLFVQSVENIETPGIAQRLANVGVQ